MASILFFMFTLALAATFQAQTDDWPRRVLLTNDDGIEANGLLALVDAFAPTAETYVIAPLGNRSGSTNYVSAISRRGIEVERRSVAKGVTAYGVDGYPADAVVFALRGLLVDDPPDLVISGVNTGPNLSDDWNLSGTVGAAQIAAFFGVPAIAVSGYSDEHPETLAAVARWIVEFSHSPLVRELEPGQYLTVSVPRVPVEEIDGVDIVQRAPRYWRIEMEPGDAETPGRERWSLRFTQIETSPAPGTDLHAYRQNRIAVVPMRVDEHDYKSIERLLESGAQLTDWPPAAVRR
jgi:5'-nucleotidase